MAMPHKAKAKAPPGPPPPEHEMAFQQANYSRSGQVSAGELLCHMCVECGGSRPAFVEAFLIMDLNGDGKIDFQEWCAMYKRCGMLGLRAKAQRPEQHSPAEIKQFDEEAQGLLQPKIDLLKTAFDALDLNKDGKVSSRELGAFQIVLERRSRLEALWAAQDAAAAEAAAAGGDAKDAKKAAPAGTAGPELSTANVKLDTRVMAMLAIDTDAALHDLVVPDLEKAQRPKGKPARGGGGGGGGGGGRGVAPVGVGAAATDKSRAMGFREDSGFPDDAYTLDFDRFKSLLMRHAKAIEESNAAAAAGAKKGKKKK
jgi:Ca2+-binding EF-hand superfamily protein